MSAKSDWTQPMGVLLALTVAVVGMLAFSMMLFNLGVSVNPIHKEVAIEAGEFVATVLQCEEMKYSDDIESSFGRSPHVRSSSSIQHVDGIRYAIAQDDANFVGLIDIVAQQALPFLTISRSIGLGLPAERSSNFRMFDRDHENKDKKMDLEASVMMPAEYSRNNEPFLLLWGSGSKSQIRDLIVMVPYSLLMSEKDVIAPYDAYPSSYFDKLYEPSQPFDPEYDPHVTLFHVPALYDMLRSEKGFSGSQLNVEGVSYVPGIGQSDFNGATFRLLQRGNGKPVVGYEPQNSWVDLSVEAVLGYLNSRMALEGAAPLFSCIECSSNPTDGFEVRADVPSFVGLPFQFDLGTVPNNPEAKLTFTDATTATISLSGTAVVFTSSAENSPDATSDGEVAGSALGVVIHTDQRMMAHWAPLRNIHGDLFIEKVEGITLLNDGDVFAARGQNTIIGEGEALIVIDVDDPDFPAKLCYVNVRAP